MSIKNKNFVVCVENTANKNIVNLIEVWHDAIEEPEQSSCLLCKDLKGSFWTTSKANLLKEYYNWNDFVANDMVCEWAYIDEISPKI